MRYLLSFVVAMAVGCVEEKTVTVHAIGECPDGASVTDVNAARWQIRLCSFSGAPEDGLCVTHGDAFGGTDPTVMCMPLCQTGKGLLCQPGEVGKTFDQVCFCAPPY